MKSLSISQEYILCSLNKKGRLPLLNKKIQVCVVASGLLDLLFSNQIEMDEKNKVSAIAISGGEAPYLESIFDFIHQAMPVSIKKIARKYCFSFSGRRFKRLVSSIGRSLVEEGCVIESKGGIFENRVRFISKPDEVDRVIQRVRAELLESGTVSDETVALVSLLDKGGQIKKYFSRYESRQLRIRLKEIQETPFSRIAKRMVDHIQTMIRMIAAGGA